MTRTLNRTAEVWRQQRLDVLIRETGARPYGATHYKLVDQVYEEWNEREEREHGNEGD